MRSTHINVIVIESLSYTGTTWVNLILGCHPEALAVGPPDRIFSFKDEPNACRVHGKDCSFWPEFFRGFDENENLFVQLADYSGKNTIIVNNPIPSGAGKHLRHPDIWVKRIRVIRDSRGVFASWVRNHPSSSRYKQGDSFDSYGAIKEFSSMIDSEFSRIDPRNPGVLFCRYEDVLNDRKLWFEKFSNFIGLEYDESCFRYWEHPIHPISGNQGTISLIKYAQGIPMPNGYRDREFCQEQFKNAKEDRPFNSRRWAEELDLKTQKLLDLVCFNFQDYFGYVPVISAESSEALFKEAREHDEFFKERVDAFLSSDRKLPGSLLWQEENLSGKLTRVKNLVGKHSWFFKRIPSPVKQLIKKVAVRMLS